MLVLDSDDEQGYAYVYLLLSPQDVSGLGYLRFILRGMALHFFSVRFMRGGVRSLGFSFQNVCRLPPNLK
jgi:hypothetical protein